MLLAVSSSCQLVGYDLIEPTSAVHVDGPFDASMMGPVTDIDAQAVVGANEGGLAADASDDAGPCPGNNCGGCVPLDGSAGGSCGTCGLGRYACQGTEALICNGGDALPVASGGTVLIDDYEDGDSNTADGHGFTFTFADSTGGTINPPALTPVTPIMDGAAGSKYSAHISGSGFTDWGAGMIIMLNDNQCSVDAGAEHGVEFYIKGSNTPFWFSVATPQTLDKTLCGGACTDFYSIQLTPTSSWTHHMIKWTDLMQRGFGMPVTFEPSQVDYLQYMFDANTTFELYVDEVNFF